MANETRWVSGDWNAICDICGFQFKASELRENWKKQRVCKDDFETRHPQDFVRARKEDTTVPWSRSDDDQGVVDVVTLVLNVPDVLFAHLRAQVNNYITDGSLAFGTHTVTFPQANDAAYLGVSTSITIGHLDSQFSSTPIVINVTAAFPSILRGNDRILPGQSARFVNYPATNTWQRET